MTTRRMRSSAAAWRTFATIIALERVPDAFRQLVRLVGQQSGFSVCWDGARANLMD